MAMPGTESAADHPPEALPFPPPVPPDAAPARRRPWRKRLAWGCAAGLLVAVLAEVGRVFVGPNFHTVLPGRVYRTAQPSPDRLERLVRGYGIRTVINLR